MNTRIGIILVVSLCLALLAPLAKAEETYELKSTIRPGTFWIVNSTVSDSSIQGGPQGNMKQAMSQVMVAKMVIEEPGPDGKMTAKITYERIAQFMSMMGMKFSFDSAKADGGSKSPAAPIFKAMTESQLEMKISPDGKVSDIKGLDEMFKNISQAGPQANAMMQQMRQMFSNEALENLINTSAAHMPDKPVAVGETWTRSDTTPIPMVGQMDINTTYKLEKVTGDIAEISIQGTFDRSDAKGNMPRQLDLQKLKGTQKGKIYFNSKTGQLDRINLTQDMGMDMAITNPQGQTMTMSMAQLSASRIIHLSKRDKALEEKLIAEGRAKVTGNAEQPAPAE